MLKVLAAVLAVLSAAISITIYTATIPAVQKQAADNAEAIQTLEGSVSDNAEAIETLKNVKLYEHNIKVHSSNFILFNQIVSNTEFYSVDIFIEYLSNNDFTDEDNLLRTSGRYYPEGSASVAIYGIYTSNDDLYAVSYGSSFIATSYLLENVSIDDISVLLN